MKSIYVVFLVGLLGWLLDRTSPTAIELKDDTMVVDVLDALGEKNPWMPDMSVPGVSVEQGKSLVLTGFAQGPEGQKNKKQSAHFVCTSCHNIVKEDPDLTNPDPEARLAFAADNQIPFLQGTTLYGVVNRRYFYNGDYQEKYGELVFSARESLRKAIQLCAVECAQGRSLDQWELESIVAYLQTIGLKIGDLEMTQEERNLTQKALESGKKQKEIKELVSSKYLNYAPATFLKPPEDRQAGYTAIEGRPEHGELLYNHSCMHCHENARYSFFRLDHAKNTFVYLNKHMARYTRYSLYQVGRYGTSPMPGKRTYMPNYTKEKMTNQQMEDLRAYIEQQSSK
ncbi:MAG: c-type cytochrome [Saprospiraceae bacterium]|nr:c-type cytochrome [Saprospiraceae bacterium]